MNEGDFRDIRNKVFALRSRFAFDSSVRYRSPGNLRLSIP